MSLTPGTTLGPYSVTAKIGEGGMGEVYRARDTKLDRDVALKVLPQVFTDDPDRLARFEREAKVLASLNHPNIGHIYGLEEAEGQKALVLELVEGPTLADRIAQEPIPINWKVNSHASAQSSVEGSVAVGRYRYRWPCGRHDGPQSTRGRNTGTDDRATRCAKLTDETVPRTGDRDRRGRVGPTHSGERT